jgi:hypothetical protein
MDCKDSFSTQAVCVVTSDAQSYCEQRSIANVGEACGRSSDGFRMTTCNDGLICSAGDGSLDGPTCHEHATQGPASCRSRGTDWCGVGLTCDETSGECRPAVPFGEACFEEVTRCEQYCDGTGRCRPAPDLLTDLFCW